MNELKRKQAQQYQALWLVKKLKAQGMCCNCDLDNWEPEIMTGHTWKCRIHKAVMRRLGLG